MMTTRRGVDEFRKQLLACLIGSVLIGTIFVVVVAFETRMFPVAPLLLVGIWLLFPVGGLLLFWMLRTMTTYERK